MYAVIFRAEIDQPDVRYGEMAAHLRELALSRFGCLDFVSIIDGKREIAISYWDSLEQIRAWKRQAEHQQAQELGRKRWYQSYQVQIARIEHQYSSGVREQEDISAIGTVDKD